MIRKSGYRFSLATNAKELARRSCSNKRIERDDDSKKSHLALGAAVRDHIGFIVEPQAAVLFQHPVGGFEIAAITNDFRQPDIFDLRDVDRGIPGSEQCRGSDRATDLVRKRMHVIAKDRTSIGGSVEIVMPR